MSQYFITNRKKKNETVIEEKDKSENETKILIFAVSKILFLVVLI
jgi:hypothetical protein